MRQKPQPVPFRTGQAHFAQRSDWSAPPQNRCNPPRRRDPIAAGVERGAKARFQASHESPSGSEEPPYFSVFSGSF
jgi:hypothetical protein